MSVVKALVQRAIALAAAAGFLLLCALVVNGVASSVSTASPAKAYSPAKTKPFNQQLFERGRQIFRFDTFGDQVFWGGQLRLHQAIAGAKNGGVGPGVSPKTALALGLKVDATAIPAKTAAAIKAGKVNLDDPAVTLDPAEAERRGRHQGLLQQQRPAHVHGHNLCPLPLDGRRLVC